MNQLRNLMEEKECEIEKRNSQIEALKSDKMQLEADVADTKYELDVSNRKLALTQKKVRA